MRNIGSLPDQVQAKRFSQFLRKQGIENTCEISFQREKNGILCSIWVHDEDQVPAAEKFLEEFQTNPEDSKFKIPFSQTLKEETGFSAIESPDYVQEQLVVRRPSFALTYWILAACVFVFFINSLQEAAHTKKNPLAAAFFITPIENAFLYDAPLPLMQWNEVIESYSYDPSEPPERIAEELRDKIRELENLPYFRGFYRFLLAKMTGEREGASAPMFVKIREGQIWRLFTPCLLHKDLLHILFNMLWLWVLGKQIEMRLSRPRILLMVVIVGILSNTAQYLMSGPYFLGFSGVIMGMAGFIWMRQRVAPWEGYPLQRSTLLFLGVFIFAMFALQFASFLIQAFGWGTFSPNIANTAHIAGALFGALLGRLSFFSWRALER